MIQKVYHADPLLCPKCNGSMRIVSFIESPETIKKILLHLNLWESRNHDPPDFNAVKHIPEATPELSCDGYSQIVYADDSYSQLTPDYDDYS